MASCIAKTFSRDYVTFWALEILNKTVYDVSSIEACTYLCGFPGNLALDCDVLKFSSSGDGTACLLIGNMILLSYSHMHGSLTFLLCSQVFECTLMKFGPGVSKDNTINLN